jgi:N-acetylmuramoyl-L-alanine amidase
MIMQSAYALEIVYPKKNGAVIKSSSTFFIGNISSNKKLTINNVEIPVVENGGFAQSVSLNYGENKFILKSGDEKLEFKIFRPNDSLKQKEVFNEFSPKIFKTNKENATLRSTPINDGINRLSQLPKDTLLKIDAQKGDFYRVIFSKNEYAWILVDDVIESTETYPNFKIKALHPKKDNEFEYYEFKVLSKIPFSILNKDNKVYLRFYNNLVQKEFSADKGFEYYYDECGNFVLKIRYKNPTIPTITIDAGHGGNEFGAIGCCGNKEKDINLKIAKYLKQELENDFNVIMTREEDVKVTLQDRVNIARENNSTLLISIHANALPDNQNPMQNRGTSVYYYHPQSKPMADILLNEIVSCVGTNNDGVRQKSLALVRPTNCISVLVETAYMINPYDNMMLMSDEFQQQCAKAIANGIRNYFKN